MVCYILDNFGAEGGGEGGKGGKHRGEGKSANYFRHATWILGMVWQILAVFVVKFCVSHFPFLILSFQVAFCGKLF